MRYSTTVPNYPDTHEDFMPTNKLQNSDLSLKDIVEQDVNDNHVMIYMKGVPDLPRCGFSSLAVRVLKEYSTCSVASFYNNIHTFPDVPLSARNILEDPELKNVVKSFSLVYIALMVWSVMQIGELKEMLKDIAANQES
ncbi:hypothetical protein TEA_015100 [Camellia sinensis var. sinensis]|uniref:Uncharacterized protein n=1 Tax=Camellia sinensis var. sinensis TaxID=542762 RepID=A0A4S4DXK0_CAMSN|nr:hypothetical protein TEA_015100 [Camellia sinensis var. sinensis]